MLRYKPFNHPLLIAVKKIAPALAAGNSVIVKPSEVTLKTFFFFHNMYNNFDWSLNGLVVGPNHRSGIRRDGSRGGRCVAPRHSFDVPSVDRTRSVPAGVLSVLPGYGRTTGKDLVSHPLVRKVDITVSTLFDRADAGF